MAYADDGTEDGCLEAMFLLGAGSSEISYTPGADQTAYEREYNKAARHVETHCVVRPRGMMSALSARDTRRAMSSLNDWVVSAVSQGVRGELVFRTKKEAQQYIASVDPRQMKQIRLRPRR